jgi:enoyl-CoA hydratase/carnithine racemase
VEGLRVEERGGVVLLVLSRPERLNALNTSLLEALTAAVRERARAGAPPLLLTGEGRAFSAGIDLGEVAGASSPGEAARPFQALLEALGALLDYPAPTLAYINGPAIAGGGELALAVDVPIASPKARLEWPEARWNLVAPLYTELASRLGLPRLAAGALAAAQFTAEEAASLGLVAGVAGSLEEALEAARRLGEAYTSNTRAFQAILGDLRAWKRGALERAGRLVELAASLELVERARRFLGGGG